MIKLPGYEIYGQVYKGNRSVVLNGIHITDKQPVMIKISASEHPLENGKDRLRREYKIGKVFDSPYIIKYLTIEPYKSSLALITEDFGGISLAKIIPDTGLEIEEFLNIALQLTKGLEHFHEKNIIHKDINPYNILIHPQNRIVKYIDFSIASSNPNLHLVNEKGEHFSLLTSHFSLFEGTPTYMSPEQTGRINRNVDYRTDFYSLGITFYVLLTGQPPFVTKDPLELVHCHIAKKPVSLHEISSYDKKSDFLKKSDFYSHIPETVSAIVMKLLEKNPEDRYQSVSGLKADLKECLRQLERTGSIGSFALARMDISKYFEFPSKLYGRQKETDMLIQAFDRVCQSGTELILVSGRSGTGKTALVKELRSSVLMKNGYFLIGKFDPIARNIAYSAFTQAFHGLIRQLAGESEDSLLKWKEYLTNTLGKNVQLLIDVIPDVGSWLLAVGKNNSTDFTSQQLRANSQQLRGFENLQPATEEMQNRFNMAFQNFVSVFAQKSHPLVLFLDDLQWADAASLNLIKILITGSFINHLLFIGTFRDNEVNNSHLLNSAIHDITAAGGKIHHIPLSPLDMSELDSLIQDTFRCSSDISFPLTKLVHKKTGGNPFFVKLFLENAYDEGLLKLKQKPEGMSDIPFNIQSSAVDWTWDIVAIRQMQATENMIALIKKRICQFSDEVQHILKFAACLGNTFHLSHLCLITGQTASQIIRTLQPVFDQEMLVLAERSAETSNFSVPKPGISERTLSQPLENEGEIYKFIHDTIQQSVLGLVEKNARKTLHIHIGRTLLKHLSDAEYHLYLFDIAEHMNMGREEITDEKEKLHTALLNLDAGKKAKSSAAYTSAAQYLRMAVELLGKRTDVRKIQNSEFEFSLSQAGTWKREGWKIQNLEFELYKESAECEYLTGNFETSALLLDIALEHARSALEKGQLYIIRIKQKANTGKYAEAVSLGIEALKMFGFDLPDVNDQDAIHQRFEREHKWFQSHWGKHKIPDLYDLPANESPQQNMAMMILGTLLDSSIIGVPHYMNLLVIIMINQSVKHGNTLFSPFAYLWMGGLTASLFQDFSSAYQFGKVGLKLHEHKLHNSSMTAKLLNTFACFISHYKDALRDSAAMFEDAYDAGLKSGDFLYAAYSVTNGMRVSIAAGFDLKMLEEMFHNALVRIDRLNNHLIYVLTQSCMGFVLTLMGKTDEPSECKVYLNNGASKPCTPVTTFDFKDFSESKFRETYAKTPLVVAFLDNYKLRAYFLFEYYAEALSLFFNTDFTPLEPYIHAEEYRFYSSLVFTTCWQEADRDREVYWKLIQEHHSFIQKIAESCPMNFQAHEQMLSAEIARIEGKELEATVLYDQAIKSARESGLICDEALANELTAKFWLNKGKDKIAGVYMTEARYCYQKWGAAAKAADVEKKYPQYIRSDHVRDTVSETNSGTTSETLDLISMMKASQAISGEIHMDNLLKKIMKIIIENAGAQKGFLILKSGGTLQIEAYAAVDAEDADVLKSIPLEGNTLLSEHIVRYVNRTGERVVLHDAAHDGIFLGDAYIMRTQPKSVLCTPIRYQDKIRGILYLENNLMFNVFTNDRVEMLNVMLNQAAISLENVRLFDDLRQTEQTLRAQEHFIHRIIDTAPSLVYIYDLQEQRNIYSNAGSMRLLGYSPEQIKNYGSEIFLKILHPDDFEKVARHHKQLETAKDTDILETEYRVKHADGQWRILHSWDTVFLRSSDGRVKQITGSAFDVSNTRQTEQEFRESEKRFQVLFESMIEGVAIHEILFDEKGNASDYVILDINPVFSSHTGICREDAIGRKATELYKTDTPPYLDIYEKVVLTGEPCRFEVFFEPMEKHFSISVFSPREKQFVTIFEDITERRYAEEELKKTRNYLANILNSSPSAMISIDAYGRITAFNPAAEKLSRVSTDEAIGNLFVEMLPAYAEHTEDIKQVLQNRHTLTRKKMIQQPNGQVCYYEMFIYPLIIHDREDMPVSGAVIRIDDITEKMRMEEIMIQTEKMMSVGGLAAGMAHEINNPLAGILQSIQNIFRRISPALRKNTEIAETCGTDLNTVRSYMEQRDILKFLEGIQDSGKRAANIVANMLNFSRRTESRMAPINLSVLLDKTIELASHDYDLKKKYDFRHIEIVREYDPDISEVRCIETEIEQVILNLLKNAAQAMAQNSELPQLIIRRKKDGDTARIEVEDNGSGMDENTRKRVFEPFFTTKEVGIGTGLGLSVSYFIVTNNHNGTMTVESEPGKGTKFIIQLPL